MSSKKVVIIATEGLTTNLLAEFVSSEFDLVQVIIEQKESKMKLLRRRMRKIGVLKTMGQIHFILFILPFIRSKKRISEILNAFDIVVKPIANDLVIRVSSVNDPSFLNQLHAIQPDLVFVNGTRIIASEILDKINYPVVNIHVGITPEYRGVHGGYWSLYENHPELFGTTLHYIDAGIDTGKIIAQTKIQPSKKDNFKTYPVLQYAAGLQMIAENKEALISGILPATEGQIEKGKLHYHPGFIQYLKARWTRGIK